MDPHEWPDLNHRKRLDEARSRYSALASHSRDARDLQKAVSCHKFGWDIGAAWSSFGWNSISILGYQDFHFQLARIPEFIYVSFISLWGLQIIEGWRRSMKTHQECRVCHDIVANVNPLKYGCFCWRKSISACLRCLEALKGKNHSSTKKAACQSEFCKDKSWPLTILLMVLKYWRSPVEVGSLSHYLRRLLPPSQVVVWDFLNHQQYYGLCVGDDLQSLTGFGALTTTNWRPWML